MGVRVAATVLGALILSITISAGGRFIWEDQQDFGDPDLARAVTITGKTAVVAGTASGPGFSDLVLRAYDVADGSLRWQNRAPVASGISTSVFVTSTENRVFAAGYSNSSVCCGSDIFVRAYNAKTGRLRWNTTFDKGADDFPQGIAATESAVVVVGYGGNGAGTGDAVNFLVRAFDPSTGAVLWDDQLDHGPAVTEIAWNVIIDGDRVFVSGETDRTVPGRSDLTVRAYDLATGFLIWQAERIDTNTSAIAAGGGRVFVAGVTNSFGNAFLVAFDQANGSVLWEDAASPGMFVDVAFKNGHTVATGWRDSRASLLRTYDAGTGTLEWEAAQPPASGLESLLSVDLSDTAVYVAGTHSPAFGQSDVVVRVHDLLTGELTFEDRRTSSDVLDLAIAGRHVVAVGSSLTTGPLVQSDFLVRAYRIRKPVKETPGLSLTEDFD